MGCSTAPDWGRRVRPTTDAEGSVLFTMMDGERKRTTELRGTHPPVILCYVRAGLPRGLEGHFRGRPRIWPFACSWQYHTHWHTSIRG